MIKIERLFCIIVLLVSFCPLFAILRGRTFFSPRAQGTTGAQLLSGFQGHDMRACTIDKGDECNGCNRFSVTGKYQQAYKDHHQAEYFFGTDKLKFSGSRTTGRGFDDILADYFALPTDFEGTVFFKPSVSYGSVTFDYFHVGSVWDKEWYCSVMLPVVRAKWDLGLCECCGVPGELNYPAGYMSTELIERSAMPKHVRQAWKECEPLGDIQSLQFGRLCGAQTETAVADVHFSLGIRPVVDDDYYFGIHASVVAPTGTRPKGHYLFEPVVGNGRHWEAGVGVTGYVYAWENETGDYSCEVHGLANFTHLFSSTQKRSYDFKVGTLSRYMLIQEIGTPIAETLTGGVNNEMLENQYHGKLMPAINKTTLDSEVYFAIQTDIALKISYNLKNFTFDIGYNLWARTDEKLECRERFPDKCFALKGDAQIYGFDLLNEEFVALNATQAVATIHKGQGEGNANDEFRNFNADNVVDTVEFKGAGLTQSKSTGITNTGITDTNFVRASQESIFLTDCDIDNASALAPVAISHTFFASMQYVCREKERVQPYCGLGGEVEYDGTSKRRRSALSLWGVWIECGLVY